MASVVFDIETAGVDWHALDDAQRTYLEKNAKTEDERRKLPEMLSLVGYRYTLRPHTDLLEAITFFGASRKWNLDFACKAFGVESPKEHGMDGFSVGPYYRAGRLREIALYCRRDVEATARLFQKLQKTLLPALESGKPRGERAGP